MSRHRSPSRPEVAHTDTSRPGARANAEAPIQAVLEAVLDGDLVRALHVVEEAGGPEVFRDDEALVAALRAERALGLELEDARSLARAITSDVGTARAGDAEGAARELLTRLVSALGLTARLRQGHDPVVIDLDRAREEEATRLPAPSTFAPLGSDGAAPARSVFEGPVVGPTRTIPSATAPEAVAPTSATRGSGAPSVRGFLRDIFERHSWLPRVDMLAIAIAPTVQPGVYALQRRALAGAADAPGLRPEEVRDRLGPGRPLPEALVAELTRRLDAVGRVVDLGALRVHDDAAADDLCRELDAEAFALGTDLVFRSGAFRPDEPAGLELLLHELTHVWQQARGEVDPGVDADPGLELEAQRTAERLLDEAAPAPAAPEVAVPETERAEVAPAQVEGALAEAAPTTAPAGAELASAEDEALQRCGPREDAKRKNPPKGHDDPDNPIPPDPDPDPDPDPIPPDPDPDPDPVPGTEECEACPEPDLEHKSFKPMRDLPERKAGPGQKNVELSLAGHKIKVEVPEAQADGEVEVVFKQNPSPFAALVFKKAKLRFDEDLRVLGGDISCAVSLGKYVQVADVTLRVFEDGRVGAELRGIQVNVADNLRALVDLVIGPEGVWGMATVTADTIFVSDLVTVKDGLLHVRVETNGSVNAHGAITVQVHGVGEATLEACYVDGKWGGRLTLARREELELMPGVVLEEIEVTGCFAPDEWWVYGAIKVRLFDKFRCVADAKYHWKEGAGKWSFEADLEQFESVELLADVTLEKTHVHVKYEEGEWDPATFHAELHHPWVTGTVDGTWDIEQNLWNGFGKVELARQLPMGDSGITLDQAEVTAYVVDNDFTEIHGKVRATFPFQNQPTFELSCLDAVYKVKKEELWATADLRSIRDIQFGRDTGFHAIIRKGAGATAIVEKSKLKETLGGVAFEARHKDKLLGDGGMHFSWVPGGGVNAGGRFDLYERFGLPDFAAGPLYLLPQPGHFEFLVENSQPKFIEAQGVGFEIAQGEGEEAGLIGGQVSGRFDFDTNSGDLTGTAKVLRSWREDLGGFGALTVLEGGHLDVEIKKSELVKAEGKLDLQLDVDQTEHVSAFRLLGHVDGKYNPKTKKVSGKVSAELKTDLAVKIGEQGDKVVIKEGSIFETTMTEGALDLFKLELKVEYWRKGELFLEGECKEAVFDFKTGLLDFLGTLTLKKDIEKRLGESDYSLALVKDVTNLEVEVRQNKLIRIGGDIAVQLRDGEGPLLEGSLKNADYRIEEELFSGDLDLELKRNIAWPKRETDRAALPPTLRVELVRGSHVSGHIQDNVFREAAVELKGLVHYQNKEQAEAYLNGRWNLDTDKFDLDGYFKLTDDLVFGADAAPDEKSIGRWGLAFERGSQVTVGIVQNALQPVGVDVKMQLRRGKEVCAKGNVTGQYAFGQEGGFTGGVHLEVVQEIGLGKAGRFDMVLGKKTRGDGQLVQSALTEAALSVELFAAEKAQKKAVLTVDVAYTGGSQFSGTADLAVLDPIRLGQRQVGKDLYAVELNAKTRATIGLENNELTAFSGAVGLDILRGKERFAEGDFSVDYDFRNPTAGVTADGTARILQRLTLGTIGKYTFVLEGGSSLTARIENSGLAWIDGRLELGLEAPKDGRFATLTLGGKYVGGDKPDFNGDATATVHKEHDLGFTAYNYGFFLQPASGFTIKVEHSELTEMHGQIGLKARQRSKKKGGMNGDVSAVLSGDAFKKGDKWEFGGRATAKVEGDIQVGTAGNYAFWIQGGTGIDIQVAKNRFVSVEGTLKGKVVEKGKDFLGFGCWVRYEAAENENEPGWVDARGDCKLLGEKELYRSGGFAFSLMPTSGYTAFIVVERNEVKEVGGQLAFRLENTNATPQPLRVSGFAEGHYDNTRGVFSGRGDIRLESDLEFAMGKNKIVLEKGSGGMTEIQENELKRLGGTLIGRFDDEQGKLVQIRATGEFNAETPELEKLEGSAVLLRELKLGPAANPWIIVDKGLTIEAKMAHNKLTYAKGSNGRFRVPALRITGGFDYITMNALGPKTTYAGKGFLEMEMLKEDKEKGRKLKGRLDLEYREDDTWNARGTVDYNITPYLGGQLTAEVDQNLDPVLGGTLVMQKKEMLPARDLFEMKFPIIPDVSIPVAGIAGFGFGARAYFGLSSLPMTLSASVGIQNFRPRQMNVPDFQAEAEIDWGLRLKAGALAYLDARLSILVASASIGIQGTAELAGDAMVKAKGKLAGSQGKYWGELGVGLVFAPSVTLKAQPYAKASLFSKEWEKTWDAYTYDLGEVFKYEWGSTYKFGDHPEPPKTNSDRQDAAMSGAPRQDMSRVNSKAEADAFGQERASPATSATQGRPQMESGEDLKKKKEKEDADSMEGLEKDGKEAADLGSVMAAVGNILTQLGHILGSLMFGPVGLVLCLAWKWMSGALSKMYDDWCTVRDYVWNNWDKIKQFLPGWFIDFIDFMKSPLSAAEKWWNADEYARKAVHAGEHIKAPVEVRGNLAANLFAGWAGEGDRHAIEDIFEVSLNKGDLRAVIAASEYPANDYASAWYRRNEWGGSRLKRIFDAAGLECDPGLLTGIFDDDETAARPSDEGDARALAGQGLQGGGGSLPFAQEIQAAFGEHDLSGVEAHTDGAAREAARGLGANAYASGEHVAFGKAPDLHTAAHEAAHVVQQRRGVALDGGVGQSGDALEQHADMVADKVVAGESAESLLDAVGSEGAAEAVAVQKKEDEDKAKDGAKGPKAGEKQGEGEEESEPPVVELQVEVKSQETPGVKPVSANAFGQVMPYQTVHVSKIETKGEVTKVHLVHFTDFQWGVQSLGNEDATVAAASLEPATRGRLAGLPKWKQMVADVLPMPGTNAPRQESFWSREHTEAHELFHIEDLRGWMVESAPAMAQKVFEEAVFTSAELEREIDRAAAEVQSVVFLGAYTYLVADKKADDQYYERPGEIRAYAAGVPGLRALADGIKARGQALEKAAADEAAKGGGDDATKLGADTALSGEPTRGPDLDEQHPIKTPGGDGEKGEGADSPKPLWPKVKVELTITEAQDATLEPNVFGSVVPEFAFEVTDAQAQGGNAVIEGRFELTLHWGVQSLGRKDASPALATAEPETAPEFEGLDIKVYEAMYLDLVPNEVGFPAQSTYWSKALAEMHEKVHLADFRAWAEDSGKRVAEDSWMMREYTAAELATQVEEQRRETEVQLQLDSVRKLKGGFPPPPYFQQPTEMNAFGTVAPHLRALAEQIKGAGEVAESQAKGAEAGANGAGGSDAGAALRPAEARVHYQPPGRDAGGVGPGWDSKKAAKTLGWKFGAAPLPAPIGKQLYAHGGFMGAAPQLIADPTWSKILFALMPDVAAEIEVVVNKWQGFIDVTKLIPMMENNPVMAAFGMWQTKVLDEQAAARGEAKALVDAIEAFEWDVFVPTEEVNRYEDYLTEIQRNDVEIALLSVKGERPAWVGELKHRNARLGRELDLLANVMASRMLIAHGKGHDLLIENALNLRQYAMVLGDKKTEYGGVMPADWMDLFGRALLLADSGADFEELYGKTVREQQAIAEAEPKLERPEAGRATFPKKLPTADVVRLYKVLFGKSQFSVVLDIKTAALTAGAIARMIKVLNLWGVHVRGVGSFKAEQLVDLEKVVQSIGGETHAGPKKIHFFHFAADFKAAVGTASLPAGSDVMFNGGSLIELVDPYSTPQQFRVRETVLREVETLAQRQGYKLGLYVQEDDIAPAAVAKLDELVKSKPKLFSLGFAWGGLANATPDNEATSASSKVGLSSQAKLQGAFFHFTKYRWRDEPLQLRSERGLELDSADAHEVAATGVSGSGTALPFGARLQQAFGHHDLSGVQAHVGGAAKEASDALGARAYATGDRVAFAEAPDLHTAAHEAAHVIQQQRGVALLGGVGEVGDAYEQHADAVADAVVRGESAEALLDAQVEGGSSGSPVQRQVAPGSVVQLDEKKPGEHEDKGDKDGEKVEEGRDDAGFLAKRDELAERLGKELEPALDDLRARVARLGAFGVATERVSAALDVLREGEGWARIESAAEAAPPEDGSTAVLDQAAEDLTSTLDRLAELGEQLDEAVAAFERTFTERLTTLTQRSATLRTKGVDSKWLPTLFGPELEGVMALSRDAEKAHGEALVALQSDKPEGGLVSGFAKLETDHREKADQLERIHQGGTEAIESLRGAIVDAIAAVRESQTAALATTQGLSFATLHGTRRFGSPEDKGANERVQAFIERVTLAESVAAHRDAFLEHGGIPAEIEGGMALDGKEAEHWKTYKVGVAGDEQGYDGAKARFDADPWFTKVASAELEVFESTWGGLQARLEEAIEPLRHGAQNGGADLSAAIDSAEKGFAEARDLASKVHEQAQETKDALAKRLGERATKVVEAKKGLPTPVTFAVLYATSRFGDERLDDAKRMSALIAALAKEAPFALAELPRVEALYGAVPELHVHLAQAKALDGDEVEAWEALRETTFGGHEAILQKAKDLGWFANDLSISERFATAMAELDQGFEACREPIVAGVEHQPGHDGLGGEFESKLTAFGDAKKAAEAMAEPNLDKAAVVARLKNYLVAEKIGSAGGAKVVASLEASLAETLTEGVLTRIATALQIKVPDSDAAKAQAAIRASIYDLIVSTPALRATIVDNRLQAGADNKESSKTSAKDALAVDEALSPATKLATELGGKKPAEKLSILRSFVGKWGVAQVGGVLGEARTHKGVLEATKDLSQAELALVHRMLLTGKVVDFDATLGAYTEKGGEQDASAQAQTNGQTTPAPIDPKAPLEVQLELAALQYTKDSKPEGFEGIRAGLDAFKAELEAEKVSFLARQAKAKAKADSAAPGDPLPAAEVFDEKLEAKRAAYAAKTSAHLGIVELIEKLGKTEAHLGIVGFKLVDAVDTTKSSTPGDAGTLELGAGGADRVDVNGDKGGKLEDEAKAKELVELHGQLGPELAMFGKRNTEYSDKGVSHSWTTIDPVAIAKLVGADPDPVKVRYCLDRLEEKLGAPYFESDLFEQLSPEQRQSVRAALGYSDDPNAKYQAARVTYALLLDAMVMNLKVAAKRSANEVTEIARDLAAARGLAEDIFAAITKVDAGTLLDPAIAPNARRPQTSAMVLLNGFQSVSGLDLVTHLENLFLDQKNWFQRAGAAITAWVSSWFQKETVQQPKDLLAELGKLGFAVKVVDAPADGQQAAPGTEDVKGDIQNTDMSALLGSGKKFVIEGMNVRPGFDDAAALAVAENVYSALNSSADAVAAMTKEAAKPTDKPLTVAQLGGPFPELLNVLARGDGMVPHLLFNLKGLHTDERDAIDSAFRARFGRTLMAEFARHKKHEMQATMSVDRDDAEAKLKNVLRGIATIEKSMDSLIAAIAKLKPEERRAVTADKPLMSILGKVEPARNEELEAILAGTLSFDELSKILSKNDKLVDDIEGVKKDITNYLNVLAAEIRKKYPDALEASAKDHAAHKAAFEAEYRAELVKLVHEKWGELAKSQNWAEWLVGNVFLNESELATLKAIILNGGSASGSAQILEEMRTSKWWGGKKVDDIKVILKGLSAADRAKVKDDLAVRVALQQGLSVEDAASCLALLEGKVALAVEKRLKILFVSWQSLDAKGLLAQVRDLDFDTWNTLRGDQDAVLELLARLEEDDAKTLKGLLKFKVDASGLVKEDGYDAVAEPKADTATKTDAKGGEEEKKDPKAPKTAAECGTKHAKGLFLAAQLAKQLQDAAEESRKTHRATAFLAKLQAAFKVIDDFRADPEFRREADLTKLPEGERKAIDSLTTALDGLRGPIETEAAKLFGDLWKTEANYKDVVENALAGKTDPAPAVVQYHSRGAFDVEANAKDEKSAETKGTVGAFWQTIGVSSEGIAGAITAATDRAFLDHFTDIARHGERMRTEWPPLHEEQVRLEKEVAAREEAAKKDAQDASATQALTVAKQAAAAHKSKANVKRAALVKIDVGQHPELVRTAEATLKTKKDRDAVDDAFHAKLIAVLGATNFASVKGKAAVSSALGELFGLDAKVAETLWDATTFEGYAISVKAHGDVLESQGESYALGMGDTLAEMELQSANATKIVSESQDGLSEEDAAHVKAMTANASKAHAQIVARADKVKGYLVASVEAAIAIATATFAGPTWLPTIIKVATSLAKNGLKVWQEEGSWNTFIRYVMKDAVAYVGGQALTELTAILDAYTKLPLGLGIVGDVSKWTFMPENEALVAAVQAGLDQTKSELGKGIVDALGASDLESVKVAMEKGLSAYVCQSGRNLITKLKETFGSAEGSSKLVDGILAKMGDGALTQLKKDLAELVGIKEEDPKDPVVKTLDADKDGKIDAQKEVRDLADKGYFARLRDTSLETLPGFFTDIPAVAFLIDTVDSYYGAGEYSKVNELYESVGKDLIGRVVDLVHTSATISLEAIFDGGLGHIQSAVGGALMSAPKDLQSKFETFKKDLTSGKYIWELVVSQATSTVEAYKKAWEKYLLADDVMALTDESGSRGLLEMLCSKDATQQAVASGFVQIRRGAADLKTTLEDYEKKIAELAGKSVAATGESFKKLITEDPLKSLLDLAGFGDIISNLATTLITDRFEKLKGNEKVLEVTKAAIAKHLATSGGGIALFENLGPQADSVFFNKMQGHLGAAKTEKAKGKAVKAGAKVVPGAIEQAKIQIQLDELLADLAKRWAELSKELQHLVADELRELFDSLSKGGSK